MSEWDRPTRLYLIRHGESAPNITPIMGGMRGDSGLTPVGVSQAERLRDRLEATGEIAADVLIASPLPRARQTAEIIAQALRLPLLMDDEVQEIRVGEADGLHPDEARARYGWNGTPDVYQPIAPGGESAGEFLLRVGRALTRIVHQHAGKTVVIICHGGVIDGSLTCFMGLSTLRGSPVHLHTQPTSITGWEHRVAEEGRSPWWLLGYNDALHLRVLHSPGSAWQNRADAPRTGDARTAVLGTPEDAGTENGL